MTDLTELAEKLKESDIIQVAASTGIHYQTLYKIRGGRSNVTYMTYKTLLEYFEAKDNAKEK